MECLTVNSIRNIINLQWNLKVKDIIPHLTCQEYDNQTKIPEKTINSIQCRIKGMEGLILSLELTSELNVLAKGHNRWSYQIIYAFAVVKDRAFLVKRNVRISFLDKIRAPYLNSAEDVSFHCLVLVGTPIADSTSDVLEMADKIEVVPSEERVSADLEGIGPPHGKFNGEIPDFTFDKAKELINAEDTNSVLKILSMEYLMNYIMADNVSDILKIAVDHDLKVLLKQCSKFLSDCVVRHNRVVSTSSSDSYSD